jgi:glycosyltransferase involved in cell wall biosynthesis
VYIIGVNGLTIVNTTAGFLTPTSGAIATWINQIVVQARDDGISPAVVSRDGAGESYSFPELHLIDYPVLPRTRVIKKFSAWRLRHQWWDHPKQEEFAREVLRVIIDHGHSEDIILTHNDPALAAFLARSLPGALLIHLFHNELDWKRRTCQKYSQSGVRTLAVSNYTASSIARHFGVPREDVQTLYNGVDLKRFQPRSETESVARKCTIGYSGLISSNKGVDLLIDSAEELFHRGHTFAMQLMGPLGSVHGRDSTDDFTEQLLRRVRRLQDAGMEIAMVGSVPWWEVPKHLQKTDIHVVPSRWAEPCPLSLLEGMACGLAVVTSRQGGLPELVGSAGLTFELSNASGLTEHLEHLLTDGDALSSYRLAAREQAEQFPWTRTWDTLKRVSADVAA